MDGRRTRAEETRRRILEATVALHCENGIFGTSWKDIAERADVSTATVYNHFPSLDDLVPACGEWIVARTGPPFRDEAGELFHGIATVQERVGRLVSRFWEFYERGEPYLELDARERRLPAVQEWETEMMATREAFAREALRPLQPDPGTVRAVSAVLDFAVFKSLRRHHVPRQEAQEIVERMLLCMVDLPRAGQ